MIVGTTIATHRAGESTDPMGKRLIARQPWARKRERSATHPPTRRLDRVLPYRAGVVPTIRRKCRVSWL